MGLVDDIKNQVKKSGSNKSKFLYFKQGTKIRVRFLDDMEAGKKIRFHDSFAAGVNVPCQEAFDRECPYCDDDELRTRDQYAWSVWDYEAKEVKILLAAVNQCSPVPSLVSMYEAYGSLCDRDYVITKSGQQQSTTFSVVPMDKAKFRNDKAKPYSESKFLQLLDKAFPTSNTDDDAPSKQTTTKSKKKLQDEWEDDDDADGETQYEDMQPKELYMLCKDRDIDVKPKKPASYYIDLLEADDKSKDDDSDEDGWGSESEGSDEWE